VMKCPDKNEEWMRRPMEVINLLKILQCSSRLERGTWGGNVAVIYDDLNKVFQMPID